jgi:UDP-N-acetylmuramyl pentapeptide phosphotransferase/UDP-N-acetylglucosamine-1-phosphate transferase
VLVLSLSLLFACVGFLPFNLGRRRPGAVFKGDSGSQVLGFALAAFGLASSWTVAAGASSGKRPASTLGTTWPSCSTAESRGDRR